MAASDFTTLFSSALPGVERRELRESVIPTVIHAINKISVTLRSSHHVAIAGSANSFGDDQLNVDLLAEQILREALHTCSAVKTISSEEDPREARIHPHGTGENYTIAFDPLDGSSIIAPNFSVGTIIGIWDGTTALGSDLGESLIGSVLGIYGPRTTVIVALRVSGQYNQSHCFELGLSDDKENQLAQVIRQDVKLSETPFKTRYFAPANLRAAAESQAYLELVNSYIKEKYTLRYSGGLVPDVLHMLVKGHGIFISPVTEQSKAKLRRLYELAPIALVIEAAGGLAVDAVTGEAVLARPISDTDERGGLICGTTEEVRKASAIIVP